LGQGHPTFLNQIRLDLKQIAVSRSLKTRRIVQLILAAANVTFDLTLLELLSTLAGDHIHQQILADNHRWKFEFILPADFAFLNRVPTPTTVQLMAMAARHRVTYGRAADRTEESALVYIGRI
jgi:hypothetical protein